MVMNSSNENRESSIPFFPGRVSIVKNISLTLRSMRIIWYLLKLTSRHNDHDMTIVCGYIDIGIV